jgi:hypothetical protein
MNLGKISADRNQIVDFAPFYLSMLFHADVDHTRMTRLAGFTQFQWLIRFEMSVN